MPGGWGRGRVGGLVGARGMGGGCRVGARGMGGQRPGRCQGDGGK